MLSRTAYSNEYLTHCRRLFDSQVAAYQALAAGAKTSAREVFEPVFCSHMIVVLDAYFVHRARGREKKDGNPLNEVRMLRDSVLEHGGVLTENKTIKYSAEKAVLGMSIGNVIEFSIEELIRLAEAFFSEIEMKFGEDGD